MTAGQALPELASVPWRPRTDARWLRRRERSGTPGRCSTRCRSWPPASGCSGSSRWPRRWRWWRSRTPGSSPSCTRPAAPSVVRPKGPRNEDAEPVAQGLLGDLLGPHERELQRAHRPGARARAAGRVAGRARRARCWWRPGGRRVHCFCVRATDPELPPSDRVAHLLLALRVDEVGLRHRGQPRVRRRALAGAPPPAGADAPGARRAPAAAGALASPAVAYEVVIAGGGFGGLYAARRLERRLPRHSARILLVTDVNFMLYTPLLPGAAAGSLEPRHVVVPLREELEWTDIRLGRVTGADPARNELPCRTVDGRDEPLRYDQLIVALGSVSRVLPVPGPGRARPGLQDAGRRDRPAQPGAAGTSRWPRRSPTTRPAASTSPSCSSARATPGWRASPSCRTTWPT